MRRTAGVLVAAALIGCGGPGAKPAGTKAPTAGADEAPTVAPRMLARGSFGERAPAGARVMAQMDLRTQWTATVWTYVVTSALNARGAVDPCDEPWTRIERVRGAAGPDGMLVEVDGDVGIADAACTLGVEVPKDGRLRLGTFVITAREGGLRAIDHENIPLGAAAALAARFDAVASSRGMAVVADVGAPGRPISLDIAVGDAGSDTTIALPDPATADHVFDLVKRVETLIQARGLGTLGVQRKGNTIALDWQGRAEDAAASVLRDNVMEAFRIPSISMWPSLEIGDQVYALKGTLRGPVARGDLVVFFNGPRVWVSRVAALGGQHIRVVQGRVTVDGVEVLQVAAGTRTADDRDDGSGVWTKTEQAIATEQVGGHTYTISPMTGDDKRVVDLVVPGGHFFALGDNRGNANDSRYLGAFAESSVIGRVVMTWLSLGPDGVRWDRVMRATD